MPPHEVVGEGSVPSMAEVAPTGLHWTKGPHHQAVRGRRRREEKKMMTSATSRWSPAPLGRQRYVGRHASQSVHEANPKDRWCHRPPPCRQPHRPCLLPRLHHRWYFLQARQALRTLGRRRISRVYAAIGCSIGSPTLPPHPAKVVRPGWGTRQPDLVGERPRKRGAASRNKSKWIWFSVGGSHQEEEQEEEN
jgi:hypothetical protein